MNKTVKKYYFNSALPIVLNSGEIYEGKDSIVLYSYKEYTLLLLPIYVDSIEEVNADLNSDTGYLFIKSSTIIHRLFLYDSTQNEGYLSNAYVFKDFGDISDTLSFNDWQRKSVDSILISNFFKNSEFDKMLKQTALLSSCTNGLVTTNIYLPLKHTITDPDTVKLVFDNALKNVPFTISQKLDSIYRMKLVDITFVFNKKFSEADNMLFPPRKIYVRLGALQIQNEVGIRSFIERCAKHYQMKNL